MPVPIAVASPAQFPRSKAATFLDSIAISILVKKSRLGRRFVSATNTIFHDAQHPSALLPVIP
jgi:hypothetical protein